MQRVADGGKLNTKILSKFNLRDKNGKNCAQWENIKMKIIFLWTREVAGWKKKTRWTGDGKNVCDDAAKSVKHSTIEEKNLEKKFSRHVFEQFLSICFIHLHVCLTNSKIKELRLPSAYSCSLPLMLVSLIRITALTVFQCRVKSSDTENKRERATWNGCSRRRFFTSTSGCELPFRTPWINNSPCSEILSLVRKNVSSAPETRGLRSMIICRLDSLSWRSYLRILLTEVLALELTRDCVWHNLTSNYFLS